MIILHASTVFHLCLTFNSEPIFYLIKHASFRAHLKVLEQQETSNVNKWTHDRFKDQTHASKMHLLTRMQNSNASYAVSFNIHN